MRIRFNRILMTALAAGTLIASSVEVMGRADRVQRRQERLALADKEWSEPKVVVNIYHRVPIIDVVGYLGTYSADDEKLLRFVHAVRPIGQKLKELSEISIQGRTMPADLEAQLEQLKSRLFSEVQTIYGPKGRQAVTDFIHTKNERVSSGFFGIGGGP